MNYKTIDMDSFPRRAHFEYFKGLAYPYVGFTVNVDITGFLAQQKRLGLPFYLALAYCVTRAANSVPEFRRRIHGDGIIEYDWCHGSHTVALPDETYCYCTSICRSPRKRGSARRRPPRSKTARTRIRCCSFRASLG